VKRTLIVPFRFYGELKTDMYCPDNRIYWIDHDGHIHFFAYVGRVIDQSAPISINEQEYEGDI
jgi:hypothetical protein